ncbi:MAG: hypothetical protein V6Z82_02700 [Flavobacteriales bacterium]
MALFKKRHFGKPISGQLSAYLIGHTSCLDRSKASVKTEVSTSTIRDVIYRRNPVTENNARAIVELMRIAVHNCIHSIEEATAAKKHLEILLSEERLTKAQSF